MASDKLQKKLIKLIKKSMKDKTVKRGVMETVKAVAKGGKGEVEA
jgi:ribosomal protein L7Ae-like RNA K-turn-binding protein